MEDRIRIGVVGTSWWADWMHLPALKSHPRAELAAICGRTRERAEAMAQKYAIPLVFSDYRDMIARGDLQALVISTPDDLHYQITIDALEAGLHVLCEKPLAMNANQAQAMYERAEARGVKHMTFFTWRWMPYFQYLHDLIESGYIGRCLECQLRFVGGYGRDGQYAWRFDRRRANGILGDLGSHMIDLARWYVGDIAQVSAHLAAFVDRPGADGQPADPANDSAVLAVEFANGAHGTIQVSAVAYTAERQMEQQIILHGEAGTLEVNFAFDGPDAGARIRGARSDEEQFQTLNVPADLWGDVDRSGSIDSQIIDLFCKQPVGGRLFVDAILENRPVSPSFLDGLKAQEVIDAALESHKSGRWITLPL
jgi:predicted dehydrogenase